MEFLEIETTREAGMKFVKHMASQGFLNYTVNKHTDPARPDFSTEVFAEANPNGGKAITATNYEVLLGMPDKAKIRILPESPERLHMKYTINVNTTVQAAEKFVADMEAQGYEACLEPSDDKNRSYFFKLNGETSIYYSVDIFEKDEYEEEEGPIAIVSIRPFGVEKTDYI